MRQRIFIDRVRDILLDNAGQRVRARQRSGSGLDAATLALVPAGNMRVFTKIERRSYHDYHIVLMLDVSGSMDGEPLAMACKATHALWYALIKSGATVDVLTFNTLVEKITADEIADSKEFHRKSYRRMSHHGGGNHDAYAVTTAVKILDASGKPGQVALVLSDGQPACGHCDPGRYPGCSNGEGKHGDAKELHMAINKARLKSRALLLAVGILTDAPLDYYGKRHTAIVQSLPELYPKMSKLLERHIIRG